MPSWYRDPDAPAPNRPRKVGVCFIVELRVTTRDELRDLPLTPVHRQIRDAYLTFDGTPVIA